MSIEKNKNLDVVESSLEKSELTNKKAEKIAGKLSEEVGIREETVEQLANTKLDALKSTVDIEAGKKDSERVTITNDVVESVENSSSDGNSRTFSPYIVDSTKNIVSQNTDALKYTGRTLGNFAIGLGKGIFDTPKDLIALIKGDKVYEAPNLPDKFA